MYCFWYNKETHQPRIVIGPDWCFCLLKIFLINMCAFAVIGISYHVGWELLFYAMIGTTFFENLAFGLTMCKNQGLCPRDPSIHSLTYLNKVKTLHRERYCRYCKIIARKGHKIEHCDYCDVCVEDLDHHCPWSSKCIAKGNLIAFNVFVNALIG